MKKKNFPRRAVSLLLALALCLGMIPLSASAANQAIEYRDPAEHWLNSAGRTNEFNANAVVTEGTMYCRYCTEQQNGSAGAEPHVFTAGRTFRVPEYTLDGVSNAYRNIAFSDGTMIDHKSKSNVMYQSPNNGGIYTGYHWTKTMCLKCGRLNTSKAGIGKGDWENGFPLSLKSRNSPAKVPLRRFQREKENPVQEPTMA